MIVIPTSHACGRERDHTMRVNYHGSIRVNDKLRAPRIRVARLHRYRELTLREIPT